MPGEAPCPALRVSAWRLVRVAARPDPALSITGRSGRVGAEAPALTLEPFAAGLEEPVLVTATARAGQALRRRTGRPASASSVPMASRPTHPSWT